MNNKQRQTMKLQQKMSRQQILLMQLLQLPVTTLEQRIKEEVEKNPLLEITSESENMMESLPENTHPDSDADEDNDTEDDDYSYRERVERDRNQDAHDVIYVSETSFSDYLVEQLSMKELNSRQQMIATEIIGSIDDTGYLGRSVELISNDLAFTQGIEVSPKEVLDVLKIVQQLDPPGIAARDLQECLSIQLHRSDSATAETQLAMTVVDNCFDPFVKHNYANIIQSLNITEEELNTAIECIHRLNPKPGAGDYEADHAHYIIPDIILTNHDGHLDMMINDRHLPKLQLSEYYQQMLQQLTNAGKPTRGEQETIDFLRNNSENATMLIDILQNRHTTMLRVMQAILQKQRSFFLSGDPADLKPLMQKDVAEITGYDVSTISRMVNSKYVQTEFGTFLLKECFTQAIVNDEGEEISTEQVKHALSEAVNNEDKRAPLTDEALSDILKDKGYSIARRTVAKYREDLGIPTCRLRRQLKNLVLLILVSFSSLAFAQQPQKESYFDSLVNARIREGQMQSRNAGNQGKTDKKSKNSKNGKSDKNVPNTGGLEIHEPEPVPTAVDTALANGDDLIDIMYNASMPAPSQLWYGQNLSGSLVRLVTLSMDSLPDEINIQLLKGNERFCFPVKNIKTSPYGWRWNRPHRGVDIRVKMGEPVHCAFNGVVRIARPMGAYGNLVVVRHYNGLETVYGHLSKINVKPMQVVAAGQTLGLGGSTGRSTGPHLHFEVRFQYEPFDPEWILDFSNYTLRTRHLYLDKTYFGIRKPKAGESQHYKADKSIIPEEQPRAKQPSKPVYAALKKDETLEAFAKRNYTTVDKIKDLNPNLGKPKSGTKIRVR